VGLACAWRNPEDILLIHQPHASHSYSFDVQNLRHLEYDPANPNCTASLAEEIVRAINQSRFLAQNSYQKILESLSPSAIQYMHQEAKRTFPVIAFPDGGMPIMDARIHAATELLGCRALKNRNVIPQGQGKGVAIIYQWTELGLRLMSSLRAVTPERRKELASQIASVPEGSIPPGHLLEEPKAKAPAEEVKPEINMIEAVKVDKTDKATSN
jgi:hypothetical protein